MAFLGIPSLLAVFPDELLRREAVAEFGAFSLRLAVALGILWYSRTWQASGLQRLPRAASLRSCALVAGVALSAFRGFGTGDLIMISSSLLVVITIALAEELLYRGWMLSLLLSKGVAFAVVMSTLLFALPHAQGSSAAVVITNVIVSAILGLSWTAIRLMTGSLWPAVGAHSLYNFVSLLGGGGVGQAPEQTLVFGPGVFAGYLLLLLIWSIVMIRRARDQQGIDPSSLGRLSD